MKNITEQEYLAARKIVESYEKQLVVKKLSIYDGCTENDLVTNEINPSHKKIIYFWVTKGREIPDRNPEGSITYDYKCNFYTLEHSHVPYDTYEKAYKNLIKGFKRKGFIK